MMTKPNCYAVLGVPMHASDAHIKRAYRKLAMQHHPDRNKNSKKSEEQFREVQIAFDVLSDPTKRQEHDEVLKGQRLPQQSTYTAHASNAAWQKHQQQNQPYPSKIKRQRTTGKPVLGMLILFLMLALVAALKMYQMWGYHANALDSAAPFPVIRNAGEIAAANQVQLQNIALSDKRVTYAMNRLYGENRIQSTSASCWLTRAHPQTGAQYCMQPLAASVATVVTIDAQQLLYLQTTGQWVTGGNTAYARRSSSTGAPPIWGAAIYDLDASALIASTPFVEFLESKNKFVQPLKLVQIACNGAFAWQGRLNAEQSGSSYQWPVLYAQKGNSIVDVMGNTPLFLRLNNLGKRGEQPTYSLLHLPEAGCIYAMQIDHAGSDADSGHVYFNTQR